MSYASFIGIQDKSHQNIGPFRYEARAPTSIAFAPPSWETVHTARCRAHADLQIG
jgi:phenylalanyl-tRNA synthetase beta chain